MFAFKSFLLTALAVCPLLAAADQGYQLRFFEPDNFDAKALNNRGQVLGMVGGAPAIWSPSGIATVPVSATVYSCDGLNDRGDVACTIVDMAAHAARAVAYIGGTAHEIHPLLPQEPLQFYSSSAAAIGNDGTVVGTASPMIGDSSRAFVYRDGRITLLAPFGGFWTEAFAVSANGNVTGDSHVFLPNGSPSDTHAFLYRDGAMLDIGTLGGLSSMGLAVNGAGQVAGWADTSLDRELNQRHPFVYSHGRMRDLGTLGGTYGSAQGINSDGWVVGESDLSSDNSNLLQHGFIYRHGKMVDLNKLVSEADGWVVVKAQAINDANEILARACREQACRPVLMVPRKHGHKAGAADEPASD
jgi:probable HAF family extracellular repeat protein